MIYLKVDSEDPTKTVHVKAEFTVRGDPLAARKDVLTILRDALNDMAGREAAA